MTISLMRKVLTIFVLLWVLLPGICLAQPNEMITRLKDDVAGANSDSDRIIKFGKLADYYYIHKSLLLLPMRILIIPYLLLKRESVIRKKKITRILLLWAITACHRFI